MHCAESQSHVIVLVKQLFTALRKWLHFSNAVQLVIACIKRNAYATQRLGVCYEVKHHPRSGGTQPRQRIPVLPQITGK